jgi:hypothetical protein
MKTSPLQRSLKKLRSEGWLVCNVEKWIAQIKQRKDAFGFGDLLAVKVGVPGALLVQTTSGSNSASREAKVRASAEAGIWLAAGNRIEVHGWSKRGGVGKRKLWQCRCIDVRFDKPKAVSLNI